MDNFNYKIVTPNNLGWLEKKLTEEELNYLWSCVENKKENFKNQLAGNISKSYKLTDQNNWFWETTLQPFCEAYSRTFVNVGDNIPTNERHSYFLQSFWVNYQKQTEFNPLHHHSGVYSFTIWLKIPTEFTKQKKHPIASDSNSKAISNFAFQYVNILGEIQNHTYSMSSNLEGIMLFFPSNLNHQVYPFYKCNEKRISIAGNIGLDTSSILNQGEFNEQLN